MHSVPCTQALSTKIFLVTWWNGFIQINWIRSKLTVRNVLERTRTAYSSHSYTTTSGSPHITLNVIPSSFRSEASETCRTVGTVAVQQWELISFLSLIYSNILYSNLKMCAREGSANSKPRGKSVPQWHLDAWNWDWKLKALENQCWRSNFSKFQKWCEAADLCLELNLRLVFWSRFLKSRRSYVDLLKVSSQISITQPVQGCQSDFIISSTKSNADDLHVASWAVLPIY